MLVYIAKIFKLISTTRLQRNTKVGNSGFVPPVNKIREDAGFQTKMVENNFFAKSVKHMCTNNTDSGVATEPQ